MRLLEKLKMGRHKITTVTPAQKEIFLVIDSFWKKHGFGPSIDDIMYLTGEKVGAMSAAKCGV